MIKTLSDKLPVFFIRMPTTEETSNLTEVDRNEVLNHGGFHFTPEGSSCSHVKMDASCTSKSGNCIPDQLEALGKFGFTFQIYVLPSFWYTSVAF